MSFFKFRAKLLNKKEVAKALWYFLLYQLCKSRVCFRWIRWIRMDTESSV